MYILYIHTLSYCRLPYIDFHAFSVQYPSKYFSQVPPRIDTDGETSGMGSSVDEPVESSTESASEAPAVTPAFLQPRGSASRCPSASPTAVKVRVHPVLDALF